MIVSTVIVLGAPPRSLTCNETSVCSHGLAFDGLHPVIYGLLLIYQPRNGGGLSGPRWLTHSGHFTHKVITVAGCGVEHAAAPDGAAELGLGIGLDKIETARFDAR